jgi:hypothetical protein
VRDADHLYKEIRIDNALKAKLKENAEVDIVLDADPQAATREP